MGILRFILALSVVLTHSGPLFGFSIVGGKIAVQAFYMISGFYMSLVLTEKYVGINNSYKLFITNRLLRLFPIYWTVLLLTAVYYFMFYNHDSQAGFKIFSEYFDSMGIGSFVFLVFTNLFLFLQDIVMFLGLDTATGSLFFAPFFRETNPELHRFLFIPQAWTIGVEITFYLIAPFLVRRKLKTILIFIFVSILIRVLLHLNGYKGDPWSYRFFPSELVFFLMGIVAYKAYVYLKTRQIKASVYYSVFVFIISLTLFFSFIPIKGKYYLYLAAFFVCLPFIFSLSKKWKMDAYIGELSYPMYISHILILTLINTLDIPRWGGLGLCLSLLTILFSIVLNELVAKRVEKLRQRRLLNK